MENICEICCYFRQHYVKLARGYQEISYGHCVYPKLKIREAGTPACHYFKAAYSGQLHDK